MSLSCCGTASRAARMESLAYATTFSKIIFSIASAGARVPMRGRGTFVALSFSAQAVLTGIS